MKSLLVLILINSCFAATSASLNLKGSVPKLTSVEISPATIALTLPLGTTQNNTKIATITERSNSKDGYVINITSINLGKLKLDGDSLVNYTLSYSGLPVDLSSLSGTDFNNVFISAASVDRDLNITYTGIDVSNSSAGDYTDTLTISISAN